MSTAENKNYRMQECFIPQDMDISVEQSCTHVAIAHKHVHYEIVYVSAGELTQTLNEEKLVMDLGQCIILSLEDIHSYIEFKQENQNTIIRNIYIMPKLFDSLLMMITHSQQVSENLLRNRLSPVQFDLTELNELELLCQKISVCKDVYAKRTQSMDLTLRILCKFFEHQQISSSTASLSLVNLLLQRFNKGFCIKGGINKLVNGLSYNRTYISRVFKKETGMSLTEYLIEVRLKHVAYYLKTTDYSLRTIADTVGIDSLSYLNKIFKDKYGMTPAKYRKSDMVEEIESLKK